MASTWSFPRINNLQTDFFNSFNYNIAKVLGQGCFGQVLLATSAKKDVDIAVKRLPRTEHPADSQHFMDEARALWNLKHSRLVRMKLVACCPQFFYIVMDVYPNGNLQETIPHLDNLHKICDFIVDIASAVHFLHKNRVVHRDIKPNNILIDGTNHAVLADLGMARQIPTDEDTCTETFGNFYLRSPEQKEEILQPFCPFKAEMFNVGVIFWMMVMKRPRPALDGHFVSRMTKRSGQIPYFMRKTIENLLSPKPQSRVSSVELLNKLYHDMPPYSKVIKKELGSDWVKKDTEVKG